MRRVGARQGVFSKSLLVSVNARVCYAPVTSTRYYAAKKKPKRVKPVRAMTKKERAEIRATRQKMELAKGMWKPREDNVLSDSRFTYYVKYAIRSGTLHHLNRDPHHLLHIQQDANFPPPLPEEQRVSHEVLKKWLDDNENVILIDLREEDERKIEPGLPNAYAMNVKELNRAFDTDSRLFAGKYNFPKPSLTDKIVMYSSPESRQISTDGVKIMRGKGFTNAFDLIQGQRIWNKHYLKQTETTSEGESQVAPESITENQENTTATSQ
eukprot:TRINITY_DN5756_c0_g3_i1.p1 TRINITY_DN5756_c0_g3~~TRINITY_DN5756_c0_g3_i1.p1  ORF type:complete len:268 (+),score=46.25 TRINITY_DN5756_c0_g3_i1:84-887(+)